MVKYGIRIRISVFPYKCEKMDSHNRYIDSCEGATYPDGTKALLLPYPDFKPEERKRVEVMCKMRGTATAKKTLSIKWTREWKTERTPFLRVRHTRQWM